MSMAFTSWGDESIVVGSDGRITVFVLYAGADGMSDYWAAMRLNDDGTLDESFGEFGVAASPVFGTQRALLTTMDGGMLMVGTGASDTRNEPGSIALVKLTSAGQPDVGFGNQGITESYILGPRHETGTNVLSAIELSNGQFLVFGDVAEDPTFDVWRPFVAKFNVDGSADESFADVGVLIGGGMGGQPKPFVQATEDVYGNIFLITETATPSSHRIIGLTKIDANGNLDTTYGINGQSSIDLGIDLGASECWFAADGAAYMAAQGGFPDSPSAWNFLVKFSADGTVDTTFGVEGHAVIPTASPFANMRAGIVQDDGKILVAGYDYADNTSHPNSVFIARLNADGNLDASFGANGVIITNVGAGLYDSATDISIDPNDGSIVISGFVENGTHYTPFVLKYSAEGVPDTDFNGNSYAAIFKGGDAGEVITGTPESDYIDGGGGNDAMNGGDTSDVIVGGTGNDSLDGGLGNDILYAGDGNDVVNAGTGDDLIVGGDGAGNDTYKGGIGSDTVKYTSALSGIHVNLGLGTASSILAGDAAHIGTDKLFEIESVIGGDYDDKVVGNAVANTLFGGLGNDLLDGGSGNDAIQGGGDNDSLNGAAGNDQLAGNEGSDRIDGGIGNDTLWGGTGNDSQKGGDGADALQGDDGNDTLDGGNNNDTLNGGTNNDVLRGGSGNDAIAGGEGDDTLDGGTGSDKMKGGAGNDTYVVSSVGDSIDEEGNADLDDLVKSSTTVNLAMLAGGAIEHATLLGTAAINATGNVADNELTGNVGANVLDGRTGDDTMNGGKGGDTYFVDSAGDRVVESIGGTAGGIDTVKSSIDFDLTTVVNVEKLTLQAGFGDLDGIGNALNNTITGNEAANDIKGGAGRDTMLGGAGSDYYFVDNVGDVVSETIANGKGGGIDTVESTVTYSLAARPNVDHLVLTGHANINGTGNTLANTIVGNAGTNRLDGGAGNDEIDGNAGNDTLLGGTGNDVIDGGEGSDKLTGGTGRDAFHFSHLADAGDTITDFKLGTIGDTLDLADVLGDIGDPDDPFGGGYLAFDKVGANTVVSIDADGSAGLGGAVTLVTLLNVTLTAADAINYNLEQSVA